MTLDEQKQQFSFAYIRAVAAAAGVSVSKPETDDDSVDLSFRWRTTTGICRSPQLDVQVKCTANATLNPADFTYPLKLKNYDELRDTNFSVPRILIVVTVTDILTDWLNHSENELAMRRCGYWKSLRGEPTTQNTASVTISLQRTAQFTVQSLQQMMERIRTGGMP